MEGTLAVCADAPAVVTRSGIRKALLRDGMLDRFAFPQKDNVARQVFWTRSYPALFVFRKRRSENEPPPFPSVRHVANMTQHPVADAPDDGNPLYDPSNLTIVSCSS